MRTPFIQTLLENNRGSASFLDKLRIESFTDVMFRFLFQLEDKKYLSEEAIEIRLNSLKSEFITILYHSFNDALEVKTIVNQFFEALPNIYFKLLNDANAILDNDPAATCLQEILIAYPGFYAISIYRFAHQLQLQKVKLIPRIWTEFAHNKTGIDIHPAATIGDSFFIDHGTGVVIGETTVIGNHVKIYQGVTLGAISVSKDKAHLRRHPTIGDHVVIYSGATILGGDTIIGNDSVIGGNVWLTKSVAPHSTIYNKSKIYSKDKEIIPEPINFII